MKLTVKDRKILYYLSRNARESSSKLGKLVGLSRGAIDHKIQRFKEEGIIRNFSAVINTVAIGHTSFSMLLKVNKSLQKNDDIVRYFIHHPYSSWIVSLSGTYDLFIEFIVKDLEHMVRLIKGIKSRLRQTLNHYEIHVAQEHVKIEHLIKDVYKDIELDELPTLHRKFSEKELDEVDKRLLEVISKESNLKLIEIASKINSTWDVVRYRMKKLESAGVIVKYFPEINLKKLGYSEFVCKLSLHNADDEIFRLVKNQLRDNANVTYSFVNVASMDFLIACAFKTIDELDSFLAGLQEKFKEYILDVEYYIVRENLKFNLFPKGLCD